MRMTLESSVVLAASAVLLACTPEPEASAPQDASVDTIGDVAPPNDAVAPLETSDVGPDVTQPAGHTCPGGTARGAEGRCRPAQPANRATLTQCADPVLTGTVRHVQAGATGTPDGSKEKPFPTLAEGLAGATPGTTVLLHPGTYAGGATIPTGVALVGRCAAEVTIEGPIGGAAVRTKDTHGVRIEGLRVRAAAVGLQLLGATEVIVRRVRIESTQRGVDLLATSALLESSHVTDTKSDPANPTTLTPGYGVDAHDQSLVVLSAVTIEGAEAAGLTASESDITLAEGTRVRKNRNRNVALQAGTVALVEKAEIDEALPDASGRATGLLALTAGALWVTDTTFKDNAEAAIVLDGGVAAATVQDVTITGGQEGIRVQQRTAKSLVTGATLTAQRGGGLIVVSASATLGPKNTITGTLHLPNGQLGDAIHVVDADDVLVLGNTIIGPEGNGIQVSGSVATLETNAIDDAGEAAVWSQQQSRVTVTGNVVRNATEYGIALVTGTQGKLTGNSIAGVRPGKKSEQDAILVAAGAAALISKNQLPVRTGIKPVAARSAFLIDDPAIPATSTFLGLPAGTAVSIAENVVKLATYGVVTQGLAKRELVGVVAGNDFSGAATATATNLGLAVQKAPTQVAVTVDFGAQ